MPRPKNDAYRVFGLRGSNAKSFEPRAEHPFVPMLFGGLQSFALWPPSNMNVHVVPPSVVFQTPHAAAPGFSETPPPLTDVMARTPRTVPTYHVFGLPGTTLTYAIDRSRNGVWFAIDDHVRPPSVDFMIPRPASESADAFGSPVPT